MIERVLVCGLFLVAFAAGALDVPYLTGRVVDNGEILSAATRQNLEQTLKAHEERSGDQIAVLTLPSLEGDSVEEFSTRVFDTWKLGRKGKDNGVLMVIAVKDRRMRIEVGYGLEGTLTDVAASRIIRNIMTPRFKNGDYDGGVTEGVNAVVAQFEGRGDANSAAPDEKASSAASGFNVPTLPWQERILFGAFIFGIVGLFTIVGVTTPGLGWFLYLFLIPFWAMFPLIVLGTHGTFILLLVYLIGFPVAKLILGRMAWYQKAAHDLKSKGGASIGGFVMSSGSSGSSTSSGGFPGGGGSSGGGGASGNW